MDAESFTKLALRVLAGEATEGERRTLHAEVTADPSHQEEYEQIKITHDVLRVTSPLARSAAATEPELPAYRLNELRTAVRQHFGPAAQRAEAPVASRGLWPVLRWIFAGGGGTALAVLVAFLCLSNRAVEVGLYKTDLVRGDNTALMATDLPAAKILTFDQDAPFDAWQSQPLAWNERAKVWVDNERDLLHVIHRDAQSQILSETQPLWQGKTSEETAKLQRDQIRQVVEGLEK